MSQRWLLILGVLVLAAAWTGPLPELAQRAFAAHMTLHMAVVAIAAPLVALGLAGGRFDPVRQAPALFAPIPASIVELIAVWSWHAPGLHDLARHHPGAFVAEQTTFVATGLLLWFSTFGGTRQQQLTRAGAGITALLLTFVHMTLLGALLALTPRPLYAHVGATGVLSALEDQQLGGAIMLVVGGVSYLAGALWLSVQLLTRDTKVTRA